MSPADDELFAVQRYGYALVQLRLAVRELAVHPGDVRARLEAVHPIFWPIRDENLPVDLQNDLQRIKSQMTKYEPWYRIDGKQYRGSIHATMRHIKKKTGARIAERLVSLSEKLERVVEEITDRMDRELDKRHFRG